MKQAFRPAVLALVAGAGALWSCGGGGGYGGTTTPNPPAATTTAADASTMVVAILGERGASSFAPEPVTARAGQKIAWRNQDGIVHRIVMDGVNRGEPSDPYGGNPSGGGSSSDFDGGNTSPGGTSNAMLVQTPGTIHYHCSIHPTMVGSIVVQ